MSTRILIVEDNSGIYDYYMRFFNILLDMDQMEIVRARDMIEALPILAQQWDIILMDYDLGPAHVYEDTKFKCGADLIAYRIFLTNNVESVKPCVTIGTASHMVGNLAMVGAGADHSFRKDEVIKIAKAIEKTVKVNLSKDATVTKLVEEAVGEVENSV